MDDTPKTLKEALQRLAAEHNRAETERLDTVARFAGQAAHDYNNLLSVINGYCEMLEPDLADLPEISVQVAEIHKAGRKAVELSRLLLSVGGRQPFNPQVIDLNALITAQNDALAEILAPVAATLHVDLCAAPCPIETDPEQFRQVLHHLVSNARDAVTELVSNEGKIVLCTARQSDSVILSVSDNGVGIAGETLPHIFEPFFTTKKHKKAVGLGLSFARGVVQRSGGSIRAVPANADGGTRFEITLPSSAS